MKIIDIKATVFIPLKGKNYTNVTKVDLVDFYNFELWNYNWKYNNGYACRNEKVVGRKYTKKYMHQHITGFEYDMIDHVNRDRLDNTRKNLRKTNYSLNRSNSKVNEGRKFRGVIKSRKKWKAVIIHNGKYFHIGTFDTEEKAAIEYNKKAVELFDDHAYINEL